MVVQVTGIMQRLPGPKRPFVQTFFLAVQEKGYYVLNDIFRSASAVATWLCRTDGRQLRCPWVCCHGGRCPRWWRAAFRALTPLHSAARIVSLQVSALGASVAGQWHRHCRSSCPGRRARCGACCTSGSCAVHSGARPRSRCTCRRSLSTTASAADGACPRATAATGHGARRACRAAAATCCAGRSSAAAAAGVHAAAGDAASGGNGRQGQRRGSGAGAGTCSGAVHACWLCSCCHALAATPTCGASARAAPASGAAAAGAAFSRATLGHAAASAPAATAARPPCRATVVCRATEAGRRQGLRAWQPGPPASAARRAR